MNEPRPLRRPHFFSGKQLTAEDFALEQEYFREKSKQHNRTLHGFGIVSGLRVSNRKEQIVVAPGLALDCEGHEIVVETEQLPPSPKESRAIIYVGIRYTESTEKVQIAGAYENEVIVEGFEIVFSDENFNQNHRHIRGRWLSCAKAHPLTIAKLRSGVNGWRVDRSYRPPSTK